MSTRNKLLESIVLALGGTVTNPNNRNQLLYDWLTALGGPVPPTRLAPNFNGVSQYGEFSADIVYTGDYSISFDVVKADSESIRVFGNTSDFTGRFVINSDGSANVRPSSDLSDTGFDLPSGSISNGKSRIQVERISNSLEVTINGSKTTFSNANTSSLSVSVVGRNASSFGSGIIYNYMDSLGNKYPMDDGWANNPTMRNTGSGADGTFINMTEAAWVEIQP